MTKFDRQKGQEVPDRDSDNARRRTKPEDHGPLSPKAVARVYDKGVDTIRHDSKEWIGTNYQANQDREDEHDNKRGRYDNDTKGWVRGEGSLDGGLYPHFDHGKFDKSSVPQKPSGARNKASGQDMTKSPFSSAHFRGKGER